MADMQPCTLKDVHYINCDISQEKQVKNAVDLTLQKFGRIDVALACAAIAGKGMLNPTMTKSGSINLEIVKKVMDVNFYGSLYLAKYSALAMAKNEKVDGERGLILFVTSIAS